MDATQHYRNKPTIKLTMVSGWWCEMHPTDYETWGDWFLPPTMHIILGVDNNLLDIYLKFLTHFLGWKLTRNYAACLAIVLHLLAVEMDCKQEMDMWVLCFGPKLLDWCENWLAVIHYIDGGSGSLTPKEKELARQDHKWPKHLWAGKNCKEIEKRVQQAVQQTAKAKNAGKEGAFSNKK